MAAKVVQPRRSKTQHNATSSKGRQGNEVYRVREHLTEAEIEKLLAALKQTRHGRRDSLIGLLMYRHNPVCGVPTLSAGWVLDAD